jgi:acyl-CoA thioesterase FadM
MYPFLKLGITLLKARSRPRINIDEKSEIQLRAGLTDIDMFLELNNARYFNYMELGRWDFSQRVGFIDIMRQNKWGVAVGGASIRYRRRIPLFKKFTLTTEVICHDGRWFYFLQETHIDDTICSSALMKVCATSKQGLVPAIDVAEAYGRKDWGLEMPDWVSAWIDAESQRPWPLTTN